MISEFIKELQDLDAEMHRLRISEKLLLNVLSENGIKVQFVGSGIKWTRENYTCDDDFYGDFKKLLTKHNIQSITSMGEDFYIGVTSEDSLIIKFANFKKKAGS